MKFSLDRSSWFAPVLIRSEAEVETCTLPKSKYSNTITDQL